MLTCRHVRAKLSDGLDGEIAGPYAAYVWVHSRICPPCRRVRRSLERTVGLLKQLRDQPAPSQDENAADSRR